MKALLINGYEKFEGIGENKLNRSLIQYTKEILEAKGYSVQVTQVEEGYDAKQEYDKILEVDVVFVQFPIYWFSVPGAFKTYIDKVFTLGYVKGTMCIGDGRTSEDTSKMYGSGGLLTDKKYMVSTTWNAPQSVFDNKAEFMDGLSLDDSTAVLHKTFQFCGLSKLPSFAMYDVLKKANLDKEVETFKAHITCNF